MRDPRPVPSLAVRRVDAAAWRAADAGDRRALGGLAYGRDDEPVPAGVCGVPAQRLAGGPACVDMWSGNGATAAGATGSVQWRHDGEWLFASIDLAESGTHAGLQALATQAYREIFETLRQTGFPHLLRLWNYLPAINADGGGLERYRQFNAGRQAAFLEAGASAFEGAPAACALGLDDGPLRIRFLAGKAAAVTIENPRQVSAYRYPTTYGPSSPTFSRAAVVPAGAHRVALLISGTASIVGHETVHAGRVRAQTREAIANLQAVIAGANARCGAQFELASLECVIYLRHAADLAVVRAEFEAAVGAGSAAARSAIYLRGDVCRADLLVEIEAHGLAAGDVL